MYSGVYLFWIDDAHCRACSFTHYLRFFSYYKISPVSSSSNPETGSDKIVIVNNPPKTDSFNDLYSPPLKTNSHLFPPIISDIRATPFIEPPREIRNTGFTQVGIITKTNDNKDPLILPLMGRLLNSRRDKWQYYTLSNTGSVNSKLPVKVKGKSGLSKNGCDEILNGDSVFLEGYKETFVATIYENTGFIYNPWFTRYL